MVGAVNEMQAEQLLTALRSLGGFMLVTSTDDQGRARNRYINTHNIQYADYMANGMVKVYFAATSMILDKEETEQFLEAMRTSNRG